MHIHEAGLTMYKCIHGDIMEHIEHIVGASTLSHIVHTVQNFDALFTLTACVPIVVPRTGAAELFVIQSGATGAAIPTRVGCAGSYRS